MHARRAGPGQQHDREQAQPCRRPANHTSKCSRPLSHTDLSWRWVETGRPRCARRSSSLPQDPSPPTCPPAPLRASPRAPACRRCHRAPRSGIGGRASCRRGWGRPQTCAPRRPLSASRRLWRAPAGGEERGGVGGALRCGGGVCIHATAVQARLGCRLGAGHAKAQPKAGTNHLGLRIALGGCGWQATDCQADENQEARHRTGNRRQRSGVHCFSSEKRAEC